MHRTVVVADIEGSEVERLGGLGLPQAQQVGGRYEVTGHRRVVRDTLDHRVWHPLCPVSSVVVDVVLRASAEVHVERNLGLCEFPWVAQTQPLVGPFDLPAVDENL